MADACACAAAPPAVDQPTCEALIPVLLQKLLTMQRICAPQLMGRGVANSLPPLLPLLLLLLLVG